MDLIRKIIKHFPKNKANKQTPLTINGVTIQKINNNSQQTNDIEANNEEIVDTEVPPHKRRKENFIEVKNGDRPENSNISKAIVPYDDKQTAVPINNITNNSIIDFKGNLEIQNDKEAEISNISETKKPSDDKQTTVPINSNVDNTIIDITDNFEVHYINNEITDNSNITNLAFNGILTEVPVNDNAIYTSIDYADNSDYNKLPNSQIKPEIVTNISTENVNYDIAPVNDSTEETTTKCIKEFEDILANVESELTLDPEITLDEVNDLMDDLIFDSDDEIYISDTESQIPIHIVRKATKSHIPTDFIDFSYDLKLETVASNKPAEFPIEINKNNTEKDAKMNTATNNGNIIVTDDINTRVDIGNSNTEEDATMNTTANNGNTIAKDVNINTNNGNTKINTTTNKTEEYDTISLSSDDNTNIIDSISINDSSDSDCGYHSSDFEFITEKEAKRDGLLINFEPDHSRNKDKKAKPASRQPKIRKFNTDVKLEPSKTRKVPNNGKKGRTGPRNLLRKSSNHKTDEPVLSQILTRRTINLQLSPRNPVQMPSYVHPRPTNSVQRPSNVHPGLSNPVQRPTNFQAGPSNPVQLSANIHAGPSHAVHMPLNVQARPSQPVHMPSNVQAEPSQPVHMPSNVQAGPSQPVHMPSNFQARPSNAIQRAHVQARSSHPVQMPSNFQAGPSNPVQMPSNVQAGPSNPVQMPPNVQAGPSNPVQMPSSVNSIPNAVNNYENYRNKYKKPFKNDTSHRNNHNEPQGDGYFDLFRGFHAGTLPTYVRENKSTKSQYGNPSSWFRGVGFDVQMMRRNSSDEEDDEFKEEAYETAQKIRSMYPELED